MRILERVLIRGGNQGTDTQREHHVRTKGKDGHLQVRERSFRETNSADTLISDFQSWD